MQKIIIQEFSNLMALRGLSYKAAELLIGVKASQICNTLKKGRGSNMVLNKMALYLIAQERRPLKLRERFPLVGSGVDCVT